MRGAQPLAAALEWADTLAHLGQLEALVARGHAVDGGHHDPIDAGLLR